MHAKIISFSAEDICCIAVSADATEWEYKWRMSWTEQLRMSSSGIMRKAIGVCNPT